eukprot:CAMPEP_0119420620 /NCGR_PEP_ID=MMETSP1335-20130426/23954_1 /TAXON_ID=259385 /ORGANISM="Chrysoculter rhomboideus, Strain RCC1486" /LENGTH=54 /DNA_ID=CAMNT_0007445987 /DNA_START=51 /DNA_END=211 /DNA_ORIENTATION=-
MSSELKHLRTPEGDGVGGCSTERAAPEGAARASAGTHPLPTAADTSTEHRPALA